MEDELNYLMEMIEAADGYVEKTILESILNYITEKEQKC